MPKKRFRPWKWVKWFNGLIQDAFSVVYKVSPALIVIIVFAGGFIGVRSALFADPGLVVRQVSIEPREFFSNDMNRKLTQQLLGKSMLNVPLAEMAKRLEHDPAVQNAIVEKKFPHTVQIAIKSRRPMALIQFSEKSGYGLVTEDGTIIDLFQKPNGSYLVIEAYHLKNKPLSVGYRVEDKGFFELLKFLDAYRKHTISYQEPISHMMLDKFGNVIMIPGSGPEIRLGRKPMEKLVYLDKIMQLLNQEGRHEIEYVDLQFENMIVKRREA